MPDPVAWWPPAPGWLWVAGVLLVILVAWGGHVIRRWRTNAYRRVALVELAADDLTVSRLFDVLKRVALVSFRRTEVAGLSGGEWIRFLSMTCREFDPSPLNDLYGVAFAPAEIKATEFEKGRDAARVWVSRHRVGGNTGNYSEGIAD